MRRLALLMLVALLPARMASAVVVRIASFQGSEQMKLRATPPDHVMPRAFPTDLHELWNAIGARGIELVSVYRFQVALGDERDTDRTHLKIERVGGSKSRISVKVDGAGEAFSLPIPYNQTTVLASPEPSAKPEYIAVTVFDDQSGANVPDIYQVGGDVVAPKPARQVNPVYPDDALKAKVDGIVILQTEIDEKGVPVGVHILKDLAPGLGDAALDAVKQWRFQPATKDGKPVRVLFHQTIQFKL